jgi:tetratricopeptide (TPR) repeat protein
VLIPEDGFFDTYSLAGSGTAHSSFGIEKNFSSAKDVQDISAMNRNQTNFMNNIKLRELLALAVLVIATFTVYSNTVDSSFHLDDERAIWDNPAVFMREINWENITEAAFESRIRTRPVAHLSFAMNYFFHRLDVRGYHVVNILIHILTGILLFYLLKATLSLPAVNKKKDTKHAAIVSYITAAVWLLHPMQTQSVTYIVQRMNSMAAMFFILSMLLYIRARLTASRKSRWGLFAGCVISGILALGSKEIAATLPFFIFMYEWFFLQDLRLGLTQYKRHWYLLTAAGLVFICLAFFYLGANPFKNIISSYPVYGITLFQKLLTETRVVVLYMALLFFPYPGRLNLDYDFNVSLSLLAPSTTFFSVALLFGMVIIAIVVAKKQRLYSFCILWFLGNLIVESSFIPLELVFEHRIYLPSMFFLLLLVTSLYSLFASHKKVFYVLCAVILAILSLWTVERNRVWQDELTLWQDCLEKSPNKWRVHNNLGKEYFRRWDTDKAIYHYQKALQINPNVIMARMNLASALAMKKRYQEAIIQLQIVLSKDPGNASARKHLFNNRRFLQEKQMPK